MNVIKILKALGLEDNLELLVDDTEDRPSVKAGTLKVKQRVRKQKNGNNENSWRWGDEK